MTAGRGMEIDLLRVEKLRSLLVLQRRGVGPAEVVSRLGGGHICSGYKAVHVVRARARFASSGSPHRLEVDAVWVWSWAEGLSWALPSGSRPSAVGFFFERANEIYGAEMWGGRYEKTDWRERCVKREVYKARGMRGQIWARGMRKAEVR